MLIAGGFRAGHGELPHDGAFLGVIEAVGWLLAGCRASAGGVRARFDVGVLVDGGDGAGIPDNRARNGRMIWETFLIWETFPQIARLSRVARGNFTPGLPQIPA